MAVELKEIFGNVLVITVTGKLEKSDYELLVPQIEHAIETKGSARLLVNLMGFEGWSAGGLWEDTKFEIKHMDNIERLAIVGDARWEKTLASLADYFTKADIRYFSQDEFDAARQWISAETGE